MNDNVLEAYKFRSLKRKEHLTE